MIDRMRLTCLAVCFLALFAHSRAVGGSDQDSVDYKPMEQAVEEGRYDDAVEMGRALLAKQDALGRGDSETGHLIAYLVFNLMRSGKGARPETLALAKRGVAIWEKSVKPNDPNLAQGLATLGTVLHQRGEFAESQQSFQRALTILENAAGADPELLDSVRGNYANLLADTGEPTQARSLYELVLTRLERTLGPEDPKLVLSLDLLATVNTDLGDFETARRLAERALAIQEKSRGPEHPFLAVILDHEAATLYAAGDDSGARELWTRALRIREKKLPPDHPRLADTLNNLAGPLIRAGEFDEAEGLLERARLIWEKALGADHPAVAHTWGGLGDLSYGRGEIDTALLDYKNALRIREQKLGPDHPLTAETLSKLARAQLLSGARQEALQGSLRAQMILQKQLRRTVRRLSGSQALEYQAIQVSGLDVAQSAVTGRIGERVIDGEETTEVWDALIRSRAQVLDEMASRHQALLKAQDAVVARLIKELESARAQLSRILLSAPQSVDRYKEQLQSAEGEVDRAERALAEKSLEFREDRTRALAGFTKVAQSLPDGYSLLAFSQYSRTTKGSLEGVPSYMAYVLPARGGKPTVISLGPAAPIDSLIERWRVQVQALPTGKDSEERYRHAGAALRRALWDPVAGYLGKARHLLIVPDGRIHLLSLATLPDGSNRYLVEGRRTLHYLSAERDLPAMKSRMHARDGSFLAVGGVDFDQAPTPLTEQVALLETEVRRDVPEMAAAFGDDVFRGDFPAGDPVQWKPLPMLPSSRSEVEGIAALWRGRPTMKGQNPVLLITGREAGEGLFKRLAPRFQTLHLATHTVWIGDWDDSLARSAVPGRKLQLSGLAFAGANRRDEKLGSPDGEDGILTSEEVGSLDLREVDWVVLSSCRSGLGPVMQGEGILGLRRTFTIAGARTLFLSLWPVTDHDAREWMDQLYRARLQGRSTADSARDASLAILEARREAGVSTHPFFWGAFVAAGDWR